ncbi:hypothetical protein BABINDRAFT_81802 [Babjeviella inositovora NRRL Y-12698]|uniref:Uncharacterized protein n=1 Tax=Babjeviella inositovora NRRL Y-12698 TaxID=984486 RepID=A0A1E3R058_9ASCO|nr:uncharacterized protein BABINDRAFT_81802 [Babjeviella inositovora NRRL Y-12698]ODQ83174.1 hypothetical protein BABINDRAFT_81802 [Babjeviella inositovora NRRL Y-12698]
MYSLISKYMYMLRIFGTTNSQCYLLTHIPVLVLIEGHIARIPLNTNTALHA